MLQMQCLLNHRFQMYSRESGVRAQPLTFAGIYSIACGILPFPHANCKTQALIVIVSSQWCTWLLQAHMAGQKPTCSPKPWLVSLSKLSALSTLQMLSSSLPMVVGHTMPHPCNGMQDCLHHSLVSYQVFQGWLEAATVQSPLQLAAFLTEVHCTDSYCKVIARGTEVTPRSIGTPRQSL